MASGRGRVGLFKGVAAPSKLTMLPWEATPPKIYGQHKLYLMG